MKKIFLGLGILFLGVKAYAGPIDWNDIPNSSYTDVGSPNAIMFSSCPIMFVGVTISSPTPNGGIAFFRSTSPTFTSDITTQTFIGSFYNPNQLADTFVPLFNMKNTSYTYITKPGTAKVTIWFKCPKEGNTSILTGPCPGLTFSGQNGTPLK